MIILTRNYQDSRNGIQQSLALQSQNTLSEFTKSLEHVKVQLSEEGLN